MRFTLVLTRAVNAPLTLERDGTALVFNEVRVDFGPLADGETLRREALATPYVTGPVTRQGDRVTVPVIAPYAGGVLPEGGAAPVPIEVDEDGPVALPPHAVAVARPDPDAGPA